MRKIIPITFVISTLFALNQGIEYWKETTQPNAKNFELVIAAEKAAKEETTLTKVKNLYEGIAGFLTDQLLNFSTGSSNNVNVNCPVLPVPTIAFTDANVSSTFAGCSGISLTATGCGSNTTRWYQNGFFQSTGTTFTGYPNTNSNYYAECWDGSACTSTQSNLLQVPVWNLKVTPTTVPPTICSGLTVELTAEISNASSTSFPLAPSYQWMREGNNIPSAINKNYTATSSGFYSVKVNIPAPFTNSCTANGYAPQINFLPTPTISPTTPTEVCPGNAVTMEWNYDYMFFQGSGSVTFQWNKGGVPISGATSTTFIATQGPGAYTLTVSKNGCANTSTAINVTNSGTPPIQKPVIRDQNGTAVASTVYVCGAGQLFANGCANTQTIKWFRQGSDYVQSTGSSVFASGSPYGSKYYARCFDGETCGGTGSDTVTVKSTMVQIVKTVGPTDCNPTLLTASSTPSTQVTFQWMKNYTDINGATGHQYSTNEASEYWVRASFTNLLNNGTCINYSTSTSTTSTQAVTTPVINACAGANPGTCTPLVSPITTYSGSPVTLQASNCNANVVWSTGATSTSIVVSATGTYTALCTNTTCTSPNSNAIQVIVSACSSSVTLTHPTNDITSNPNANGNLRQASASNGSITATNWITGNGTKVTYEAKSITLSPGFTADTGTIFTASTGGCN
ncbi:3-coathanger stack domain-containing protein [Emticicia sp. BO119]|uniref:3-coathanger stack domain-containing protein n=1 Tax=Emticicia sp. BO119 TaxID=2757768 RepID=UPI0015F0299B|nr:3-coathanger stack domain-containing protein [Emticicia sp. BO119]MBA4850552.1 hypothetical protein [Emticicia sp. BO119]